MRGGRSINKALIAPVLLLLFTACGANIPWLGIRPNLPYRVWESWAEMQEVLGDHFLYPTYLPEVAMRSEHILKISDYNHVPRHAESTALFFGYYVIYRGDPKDDFMFISAFDVERMNNNLSWPFSDYAAHEDLLHERERFNNYIVTAGGIDISFFSVYGTFIPMGESSDEWNIYHPQTARIVHYTFTIDTVTYEMSWVQHDVDDKYADDAQREGMLRVATSIIEQVREVE